MKYAFQDEQSLHLLLDLMSGGELQFHLNRFGVLPEKLVQFYTAGIVLAISYLHQKDIVYRDLKPENIMLDNDGYVRLTDLGLCSFIKSEQNLHRHCGTRSYMAPEQCCGIQGYNKSVDWWSLGVTIYQLLTGKNPFLKRIKKDSLQSPVKVKRASLKDMLMGKKESEESKENIDDNTNRINEQILKYQELITDYKDILNVLTYPNNISDSAKNLCIKFLELDPNKRLGSKGVEEIKLHPFFKNLDWNRYYEKHISPPFHPDSNYVNADYLEATVVGLARATRLNKEDIQTNLFPNFEYINHSIFQEEVLSTVHDTVKLINGLDPIKK
jgi:serine/threonine protein kinase